MSGEPEAPRFLLPDDAIAFPDPEGFDAEGLVAVGGDLRSERLLEAYRQGIFPWYDEGYVPMWWSPDPRALMTAESLHVSRSLQRVLRRGDFRLSWNACFARVMRECGRKRDGGSWIIPEMLQAYGELHRLGHAHSLEVWSGSSWWAVSTACRSVACSRPSRCSTGGPTCPRSPSWRSFGLCSPPGSSSSTCSSSPIT